MADREKVIKGFECCMTDMNRSDSMPCRSCPYGTLPKKENCQKQMFADVYALLKEQDETIKELQNAYGYLQKQFFEVQDKLLKEQETEWEHLWDASDGTFKGRCKKCGFVHFFIEGHDTQYKFCPQCGEQKQEL